MSAANDNVRSIKRQQIDAGFSEMASDESYRKQAAAISLEFEESDWETVSGISEPLCDHRSGR